jgi:hypothetical protein
MEITWRPIRVSADSVDEERQRVLVDYAPVAILVHRSSPFNNPELQQSWASVLNPSLTEQKLNQRGCYHEEEGTGAHDRERVRGSYLWERHR